MIHKVAVGNSFFSTSFRIAYFSTSNPPIPLNPPPSIKAKCFHCGEVGHLSRNCPHRLCFNCGQPGHIAEMCLNPPQNEKPITCFNCGKTGHFAKDCNEPQDNKERMRERVCLTCGLKGHIARYCPATTCFRCGEKGHSSYDCPLRKPGEPANPGGKKTSIDEF